MKGVVYFLLFISLISVVFGLPSNLGFEDGNLNLWDTNYSSFGQDYTSIASTDWSTEGNYSVFMGGANGVFFGIPQHYATINHTNVTISVGDQVCLDVFSDNQHTVKLFSTTIMSSNLINAIPPGEMRDVCAISQGNGSLDLTIQGRLIFGCQSICLTKVYIDNIRVMSCTDGALNNNETDVDCGGPYCGTCSLGKMCLDHSDCDSGICDNGVCSQNESLLEKYAPVLYFHPDEQFFPTSIDAMLNESDLIAGEQVFDQNPVDISNLDDKNDSFYLDMINASGGLGLAGTVPNPSRFSHYDKAIYARKYQSKESITILQYWFFYPYNDWRNNHEGDWEMIQVNLNTSDLLPISATYSYHWGGETSNWSQIQKFNETHPKVYVTEGGHGSWIRPGDHKWFVDFNPNFRGCSSYVDETSDQGAILKSKEFLIQINGSTSWINFSGLWGQLQGRGSSGPDSPANIKYGDAPNRWNNPIVWSINPSPTVYTACTGSPVDLQAFDQDGNRVGLIDGNISIGINGTYLYLPSENESEIIVILAQKPIVFVVNGTGKGSFNLSIAYFDRNTSTNYSLEYKDIPVNESTTAILNVSPTNPNFVLKIDSNGDGITDNTTTPDEISGRIVQQETDSDNDGFSDSIDNCPNLYNPNQETDLDDDGFDNLLCGGNDCDDENQNVNPNASESCNNLDDNCNSQIDESLTRVCGLTDVGICTFGNETCMKGNWTSCDAVFPQSELCNSLDDDCDFEVDNGFNVSDSCSVGIGECKADGFFVCSNDNQSSVCSAVPKNPKIELCDGKDNDCNGVMDNSCSVNNKLHAITLLQAEKDGFCNSRSRWRPCKDQIIDQIITRIENSLNPNYFIDNETLNPSVHNYGLAVFRQESRASKICNVWRNRVGIKQVCNTVQDLMKAADKKFAEIALADAKNSQIQNPANQRCYDTRIKKAENHIQRANNINFQLLSHWAISEYGKSWRNSQEAIRIASASRRTC